MRRGAGRAPQDRLDRCVDVQLRRDLWSDNHFVSCHEHWILLTPLPLWPATGLRQQLVLPPAPGCRIVEESGQAGAQWL